MKLRVLIPIMMILVFVCSNPSVSYSQGVGKGWRMEGFNPQRSNIAPVTGPSTLPIFEVLASNTSGRLRRIADDGSLIFHDGHTVYCHTATGTLIWSKTIGGIADIALGSPGPVYVSFSNYSATYVVALRLDTGEEIWNTPFKANDGNESSALAIGTDGTIYINTGASYGPAQHLKAINPDGTEKLDVSRGVLNLRGYMRTVFNKDESIVYMLNTISVSGTNYPNGVGISTSTGQIVYNTACFQPAVDVYAFAPWNRLFTGEGYNRLVDHAPDLLTCNQFPTGFQPPERMIVGVATFSENGIIVAQTYVGGLDAWDREGRLIWSSHEQLSEAFSDRDGVLYAIAPMTKEVVALNIATGEELWRKSFTNPVSGLLIGGDGNLYLTSGSSLIKGMAILTPQPNLSPIAGFTMSGEGVSAHEGQSLAFQTASQPAQILLFANRSHDPDGSVIKWDWTVNGVSFSDTNQFFRKLGFGDHTITLVVTDNLGRKSATARGWIKITPLHQGQLKLVALNSGTKGTPNPPIAIIAENLRSAGSLVVSDVIFENRTGTWYVLKFDYEATKPLTPSATSDPTLKGVFLLGPHEKRKFTSVKFYEGQFLHYDAESGAVTNITDPEAGLAFGAFVTDMFARGLLGVKAKNLKDASMYYDVGISVLGQVLNEWRKRCGGSALELGNCMKDKSIKCFTEKLVELVLCVKENQALKTALRKTIVGIYGEEAGKKLDKLLASNNLGRLLQIAHAAIKLWDVGVLFRDTIRAPVGGYVRLEAIR